MKTTGLAFKVGIFVLLGLIALGYMTIKITKYKKLLVMKGYEIYTVFDDVAGLKRNNSVLMAGVGIGRVKEISLENGKAKVTALIKPHIKIAKDAQVRIRGYGMVGTKYLEIVQGKSEKFIEPGETLTNTTSVANVDAILNEIDDYLKTEKESLKEITENIKEASANLADISQDINRGKGSLGKFVKEDKLYKDLEDLSDRIDNIVAKIERGEGTLGKLVNDEELYQKTERAIDDLSDLMADIKAGKGTIGKLWKDESLYNQANDTINRVNNIVTKVERGEGTLGKFINDESLYQEARDTLRNIRETSTTMREQTPLSVIGTAVGIAK